MKKFSLSFTCLVALPFLLFYIVLFSHPWIPRHDTLQVALAQMPFYRAVKFSGELPQWQPFMQLGLDPRLTHLQINLHPSMLFISTFIRWLPTNNGIFLFYLSALFDELLLLLGIFLLGEYLFKRSSTLLFLSICTLGATHWFSQPFFPFYFVYSLPLSFYFILKGVDSGKLSAILFAYFLTFLTAMLGSGVSGLCFLAIILVIFHACAWRSNSKTNRAPSLSLDAWAIVWGGLLTALIAAFFTYAFASEMLPVISSPGRLANGQTSYDEFLSFSIDRHFDNIYGILTGSLEGIDGAIYSGFLTLPFAIIGAMFSPLRKQVPFLVVATFLFLLYCGSHSFVAPMMGVFPFLRYFRYPGAAISLLRIPLLFLAAYGWQSIFTNILTHQRGKFHRFHINFVLGLVFGTAALVALQSHRQLHWELRQLIVFGALLLTGAALYLASFDRRYLRRTLFLLLSLCIIDIYSYRSEKYHSQLTLVGKEIWNLFELAPISFIPKRNYNIMDNEKFRLLNPLLFERPLTRDEVEVALSQRSKYRLTFSPKAGALYSYIDTALDIDPCSSIFRLDSVLPLVNVFYGIYDQSRTTGIQRAMGCETNKLQVYSQVEFLNDADIQKRMASENFDGSKLLLSVDTPIRTLSKSAEPAQAQIELIHFEPNRLQLRVRSSPSNPSYWLYYADAWHPNWKVTVNHSPGTIVRANLAFKAVEIPSGSAEVVFFYQSLRDKWILIFFQALSFLLFPGLLFWQFQRKRPRDQAERKVNFPVLETNKLSQDFPR